MKKWAVRWNGSLDERFKNRVRIVSHNCTIHPSTARPGPPSHILSILCAYIDNVASGSNGNGTPIIHSGTSPSISSCRTAAVHFKLPGRFESKGRGCPKCVYSNRTISFYPARRSCYIARTRQYAGLANNQRSAIPNPHSHHATIAGVAKSSPAHRLYGS